MLIPSWRFFDAADPLPALEVRTAAEGQALGPWRNAIGEIAPRRAWHLVWNAAENDRLARQGLVRQLLDDVNDLDEAEIPSSVSYELVRNLVLDHLSRETPPAHQRFQFRITLEGDEILLAPEEERGE